MCGPFKAGQQGEGGEYLPAQQGSSQWAAAGGWSCPAGDSSSLHLAFPGQQGNYTQLQGITCPTGDVHSQTAVDAQANFRPSLVEPNSFQTN